MFPQVSEDGKLVVVAVADSGGARAEGSVSIQIVDVATDRVARAFVLSDGGPSDAADPRQWVAAKAFLASGHWRKLHHFEIVDDPGAPQHPTMMSTATVQLARSDRLVVLYHEPRLQIAAVEDGGQHPLREAMVPKWSAKPPGPQCPKPWASLTDAYGDLELRVAVLFIEYHGGSDVCWEPETTVHAIRWPAMR
jgi:hypothetical protein